MLSSGAEVEEASDGFIVEREIDLTISSLSFVSIGLATL
jgi:hypothetical protein